MTGDFEHNILYLLFEMVIVFIKYANICLLSLGTDYQTLSLQYSIKYSTVSDLKP